MSPEEHDVAEAFHQRVRAASWDQLADQLAHLHRPRIGAEGSACQACTHAWPCRTYALVAAAVLEQGDVERGFVAALVGGNVLEAVTRSR